MEVLYNNFNEVFYNMISDSKLSIKLCAPYVKNDIISKIMNIKANTSEVTIISNFNFNNFYKRASDLLAFQEILFSNGEVYNNQNLHAKMYIVDENEAIVTSANLTYSAFNKNVEYGIRILDKDIIKQINNDYQMICKMDSTGQIGFENIIKIQNLLNSLDKYKDKTIEVDENLEVDSIFLGDKNIIKSIMTPWNQLTFNVIENLESYFFTLSDINKHENIFQKAYPNNNTIKDSIRRNLQELRDLGLIKFEGNGHYKKLWK